MIINIINNNNRNNGDLKALAVASTVNIRNNTPNSTVNQLLDVIDPDSNIYQLEFFQSCFTQRLDLSLIKSQEFLNSAPELIKNDTDGDPWAHSSTLRCLENYSRVVGDIELFAFLTMGEGKAWEESVVEAEEELNTFASSLLVPLDQLPQTKNTFSTQLLEDLQFALQSNPKLFALLIKQPAYSSLLLSRGDVGNDIKFYERNDDDDGENIDDNEDIHNKTTISPSPLNHYELVTTIINDCLGRYQKSLPDLITACKDGVNYHQHILRQPHLGAALFKYCCDHNDDINLFTRSEFGGITFQELNLTTIDHALFALEKYSYKMCQLLLSELHITLPENLIHQMIEHNPRSSSIYSCPTPILPSYVQQERDEEFRQLVQWVLQTFKNTHAGVQPDCYNFDTNRPLEMAMDRCLAVGEVLYNSGARFSPGYNFSLFALFRLDYAKLQQLQFFFDLPPSERFDINQPITCRNSFLWTQCDLCPRALISPTPILHAVGTNLDLVEFLCKCSPKPNLHVTATVCKHPKSKLKSTCLPARSTHPTRLTLLQILAIRFDVYGWYSPTETWADFDPWDECSGSENQMATIIECYIDSLLDDEGEQDYQPVEIGTFTVDNQGQRISYAKRSHGLIDPPSLSSIPEESNTGAGLMPTTTNDGTGADDTKRLG